MTSQNLDVDHENETDARHFQTKDWKVDIQAEGEGVAKGENAFPLSEDFLLRLIVLHASRYFLSFVCCHCVSMILKVLQISRYRHASRYSTSIVSCLLV